MPRLPQDADPVESGPFESFGVLSGFRQDLYACLEGRADELFELTDAVLCAQRRVRSLAELSLEPELRRGHGGLYDGLNAGRIGFARLRRALDGLPLPRVGERIVLGVRMGSSWPKTTRTTAGGRTSNWSRCSRSSHGLDDACRRGRRGLLCRGSSLVR